MARTVEIQEGAPASRPAVIVALCGDAAAILERAWTRTEGWIAYRWGIRNATFIVEGAGEWTPPLAPFTLATAEIWENDAWAPISLRPSALGGVILDGRGPYRLNGSLGSAAAPPELVIEAVRRLARYFGETAGSRATDGALRSINEPEKLSVELQANWSARALQYSGAADLLRPWRILGGN
jgi:hypothetical protein